MNLKQKTASPRTVRLSDIPVGELFVFEDDLYLKIHSSDNSPRAVNVLTNWVCSWSRDVDVLPVKHEPLVWELA